MGDTTALRRTVAASVAALALALTAAGCGGSSSEDSTAGNSASASTPADTSSSAAPDSGEADGSALSDYVNAAQASIPKLKQSFASTYSDITITASGNSTLVYTYTYKKAVDPDSAKAAIEKTKSTLQQVCDSQVFPEMKARGIPGPEVTYTYLNSDGSKIWSHTFSPSK